MSKTVLPKALELLIDELTNLPGVGSRTAERYAYYIFKSDPAIATHLSAAIKNIHESIKLCPITYALIDQNETVSSLYSNSDRDKTTIAIVEEPLDIVPIENTNKFHGTYHVLGGVLSPIDGIGPEQLHIKSLIDRIKKDKVKEIIIATNPSVEGESTAIYLQKFLKNNDINIKMTRLARGIPIGVDLEYTDQITLSQALEKRQTF